MQGFLDRSAPLRDAQAPGPPDPCSGVAELGSCRRPARFTGFRRPAIEIGENVEPLYLLGNEYPELA